MRYITDRNADVILRFAVNGDGSLGAPETFTGTAPRPDGLTVDTDGNLYVATAAGVEGFAPDGTTFGILATPEPATGVTFGGLGLQTLYATTPSRVFAFAMMVRGVGR